MIAKNYPVAGAVVFWTATDSDRGKLVNGLGALGFADLIPNQRTDASVLESSLKDWCDGKNKLIKKDGRKKIVQAHDNRDVNGFEVVEVEVKDRNNYYSYDFGVGFDANRPGALVFQSAGVYIEQEVCDLFNANKSLVTAAAVGQLLVKIVAEKLGGVCLRESGGVYWIPEHSIDVWERVSSSVEFAALAGRNKAYLLRTQMDECALKAVKDAIFTEVMAEAERIRTEVYSGDLGDRALDTRKDQALELGKRVEEYETLLGETMADLKLVVKLVQESTVVAALSAFSC